MSLEPGKLEIGNGLSWAPRRCLVLDLVGKKGRSKPVVFLDTTVEKLKNVPSRAECRVPSALWMPRCL